MDTNDRCRCSPRTSHQPIGLVTALVSIGLIGCQTLRIDEPIAVIPEATWSVADVELLQASTECWNMQFGTLLQVRPSKPVQQEVRAAFSDFVCARAYGLTEPNLPVSFYICPTRHFTRDQGAARRLLFQILVHELGHVLNIRSEGTAWTSIYDPRGGVMGMPPFRLPTSFSDEDERMLAEANPGMALQGTCSHIRFIDDYTGTCCSCRCP